MLNIIYLYQTICKKNYIYIQIFINTHLGKNQLESQENLEIPSK